MSAPEHDPREVLAKFMAVLNAPSGCLIRDAAELAHPKDIVRFVLQHCIRTAGEEEEEARIVLRDSYLALAHFQTLNAEEKAAVAVLAEVGAPAPEGSELHQQQSNRLNPVAVPLQAVMDRVKAERAVLAQELKSLFGSAGG